MEFKLVPVKEIPVRIRKNQYWGKDKRDPYDFEGEISVQVLKLRYCKEASGR